VFAPVEPVPAAAPSTGLVVSAITPSDGARWQDGISWRSEGCPQGRGFDPCATGSDVFEDPAVGGGGNSLNFYRPVAFRVEDQCSTRSGSSAHDKTRVRRQAIAATSFMVARELETGALSAANPYSDTDGGQATNAYLGMLDGEVIAGEWNPTDGLGELEQVARANRLGQDVFLHVPVGLITRLGDHLVKEGNLLLTRTGARVVADAGYQGIGPTVLATSEIQTVTITGAPTGGTFTLTYSGQTTGTIPFNAVGGTVQTALNALSNLDGVSVTGGAGGPYTVTFAPGNVPQMTASGAGLTGGTAPAVGVVTATPGADESVEAGTWIYATGPVVVRLDDPVVDSLVDHQLNVVVNTADRLFAAYFDPCTLYQMNVTEPAPVETP